MSTVRAGGRPRQIRVEMHEPRARDMRLEILRAAPVGTREIMAAVEHDPVRIVEVGGERVRGNQGGVVHCGIGLVVGVPL